MLSWANDSLTSLAQGNTEDKPDSTQADSDATEESPHEGLEAHSGLSQEYLRAMVKPSEADMKTCSEPDEGASEALPMEPEVDLKTWAEQPKEDLMSYPVIFGEPIQDCLEELPEEEPSPSLIDSKGNSGLSQETKDCLPLKTDDETLLPKESVERAHTKSSVRQGPEGGQTRPLQASFPLEEAQKLSQNSKGQSTLLTHHKLEEPQSSTFHQNSEPFEKMRKVMPTISHEKSQDGQLQSVTTNSHAESPQPFLQCSLIDQSISSPRAGQRVPKHHLNFYPHLLCHMEKGVMLKIFSYKESGLIKEGKCLYVCDKFLMGRCKDGLKCPGYHTLLPFHWQFLSKEDNLWHSVSFGTQLHLEMVFADPNNTQVCVFELHGFTTFLDMPSLSFSTYSCYSLCRRLSCQKGRYFAPCDIPYLLNGETWTLLNKNVQGGANNFGLERTITTDDGKKVLPENVLTKDECKSTICYRPRYIPLHLLVKNLRIWDLEKPKDLSIWGEDALDLCLDNYTELRIKDKIPKNQHFILMEILPSETTYHYCCKLFHISMNPKESVVLRIFRLYNPKLWEQYKRQKAKMTDRKTVPTSLEYHLFHETNMNLEDLGVNGLCSKLSKEDGALGYGTYFSLHAKTASWLNFAYNSKSERVMVLAKVLVGENTVGQPGLQGPPFKPDGQQFDSCVNTTDMPTLFVVFKEEYSFPQFIILYKNFNDAVDLVF